MPWQQSRRRQMRRLVVAVIGRARQYPPGHARPPSRLPKYHRLHVDERRRILRLRDRGHSARRIGRRLKRNHRTVLRALTRSRLEKLELDLVNEGRFREAWKLAERLGDPALFSKIDERIESLAEAYVQRAQRREQQLLRLLPVLARTAETTETTKRGVRLFERISGGWGGRG